MSVFSILHALLFWDPFSRLFLLFLLFPVYSGFSGFSRFFPVFPASPGFSRFFRFFPVFSGFSGFFRFFPVFSGLSGFFLFIPPVTPKGMNQPLIRAVQTWIRADSYLSEWRAVFPVFPVFSGFSRLFPGTQLGRYATEKVWNTRKKGFQALP